MRNIYVYSYLSYVGKKIEDWFHGVEPANLM